MELFNEYLLAEQQKKKHVSFTTYLDVFYFTPYPRFYKRRVTSFRSFVVSILLILVCLGYAAFVTRRFLFAQPSTSVAQVQAKDLPNVTFPQVFVGFQLFLSDYDGTVIASVSDRTASTVAFANESFFRVNFYCVFVDENGEYHSDELEGEVVEDATEILGARVARKMWAPTKEALKRASLGGLFTLYREYTYVEVEVITCEPESAPAGVKCASLEEQRRLWQNGEFILGTKQVAEEQDVVLVTSFSVVENLWQWYDTIYGLRRIVVEPDFVRSFLTKSYEFLERQLEILFIVSTFNDSDEEKNGRVLLTWRFLLNSMVVTETRQPLNLLDVLGSIAALVSALYGPLALYLRWHNKQKFYSRHPKWSGFDEEFRWISDDYWKNLTDKKGDLSNEEMEIAVVTAATSAAPSTSPTTSNNNNNNKESLQRPLLLSPQKTSSSSSNLNNNNNNSKDEEYELQKNFSFSPTISSSPTAGAASGELESFLDALLVSPSTSSSSQQQHQQNKNQKAQQQNQTANNNSNAAGGGRILQVEESKLRDLIQVEVKRQLAAAGVLKK